MQEKNENKEILKFLRSFLLSHRLESSKNIFYEINTTNVPNLSPFPHHDIDKFNLIQREVFDLHGQEISDGTRIMQERIEIATNQLKQGQLLNCKNQGHILKFICGSG